MVGDSARYSRFPRSPGSKPSNMDIWLPPRYPTPLDAIYVDAKVPAGGSGTKTKPFQTIQAAVSAAKGKANATIVLISGTYYVNEQILIEAQNNGLTIQNYEGGYVNIR